MQPNTYVSIWNFIVFVLDETLDVYTEWETFIRHGVARLESMSERREIFIDHLVAKSMVSLPSEQEIIPEQIDAYFSWFFTQADLRNSIVPSPDAIIRLKQAMTAKDYDELSVHERELFAMGYMSPLMKQAGFEVPMYFRWLSDHKAGSLEDKKIALVSSWMKEMQRAAAEKQGFSIHNVFSNDPVDTWHRYSYTAHLTSKLNYDLLLVNCGHYSGQNLADIAKWLIETGGVIEGEVFTMPGITVNKVPLRMVASAQIPVDEVATTRMQGAITQGMTQYVQIFIGDKNNILPGEEGYDSTFDQTLTVSKDNV